MIASKNFLSNLESCVENIFISKTNLHKINNQTKNNLPTNTS
jgi:hypothetical protein